MTAVSQLLDINVDELFEQHSIADIDRVHKKLQTDVEHKKEELRTMVGERYRDLLQAADTIGTMRTNAHSIITHIDDITATCRHLNEQQLIGFRNAGGTPTHVPATAPMPARRNAAAPPPSAAERAVQQFHGIGVQLRALAALPELIWSHLDAEEFFVAAQLFALSRHISTGLQLDVHRPVMRHFPVARQLWATLSPFHQSIRAACWLALGRREIDGATAAGCLAGLLLLENGSMDRLLGTLIQVRGNTFRATLSDERPTRNETQAADQQMRIQDRVLASLEVLLVTLRLVHECFVLGGVRREVDALQADGATPTLELVQFLADDAELLHKVPEIIAKFRPRIQLTELPAEALRTQMAEWLRFTSIECKRQIRSVIDGIASVKTIHKIRQQVLGIETPTATWPQLLESLHLPVDLDLYKFYYQPVINERVKQIIQAQWTAVIAATRGAVEQLALAADRPIENAATKWTPHATDVPLSLKQALSADRRQHRLLMRTKGYTPAILSVCTELDEQLQTIHADLQLYLGATAVDPAAAEDTAIVAYLQATSRDAVAALIDTVRASGSPHRSPAAAVAFATLLRAIVELCPNLKRCLCHNSGSSSSAGSSPEWQQTCDLLGAEASRFWSEWIQSFISTEAARLLPVGAPIDHQHCAADWLTWETRSVEEKDEHDAPVQSAIRVPAHVSVAVQQLWHRIGAQLLQIAPYTLPRSVTAELSAALTAHLLRVFEARAEQAFVAGSQTASLQCYFDVRFVQLVFVRHRGGGGGGAADGKAVADAWQAVAGRFKANVDPFDFELFHKYVLANVKRAVARMQNKLGVLIAQPAEQLASVLAAGGQPAAAATTAGHDLEPNVLTLSARGTEQVGYFSLLPVLSASTGAKGPTKVAANEPSSVAKTKRSKSNASSANAAQQLSNHHSPASSARAEGSNSGGSSAPNLANVKSGAAAFFGAMSKDWFQ